MKCQQVEIFSRVAAVLGTLGKCPRQKAELMQRPRGGSKPESSEKEEARIPASPSSLASVIKTTAFFPSVFG